MTLNFIFNVFFFKKFENSSAEPAAVTVETEKSLIIPRKSTISDCCKRFLQLKSQKKCVEVKKLKKIRTELSSRVKKKKKSNESAAKFTKENGSIVFKSKKKMPKIKRKLKKINCATQTVEVFDNNLPNFDENLNFKKEIDEGKFTDDNNSEDSIESSLNDLIDDCLSNVSFDMPIFDFGASNFVENGQIQIENDEKVDEKIKFGCKFVKNVKKSTLKGNFAPVSFVLKSIFCFGLARK